MSEQNVDLTIKREGEGFVLHEEGREEWHLLKDAGGYSPMEALEAAAAVCGSYVLTSILKRSRVEATVTSVSVKAERANKDGVYGFASLSIFFFVDADEKDHERVQQLVPMVKKYCPVIRSLNPDIAIKEQLEFVSKK